MKSTAYLSIQLLSYAEEADKFQLFESKGFGVSTAFNWKLAQVLWWYWEGNLRDSKPQFTKVGNKA